jgi:hypothetical protein
MNGLHFNEIILARDVGVSVETERGVRRLF